MTPNRCAQHSDGEYAATQPMGLFGGYRCWRCRANAVAAQIHWRFAPSAREYRRNLERSWARHGRGRAAWRGPVA